VVIAFATGANARAEVAWYDIDDGSPVIIGDALRVDEQWIGRDRARIPVRLAATNISRGGLRDVKVQIGYPSDVTVVPHGEQRLDSDRRLLVYEYAIGQLPESGRYTMLPTDEIVLQVIRPTLRFVYLDETGFPSDFQFSDVWLTTNTELADGCLIVDDIPLDVRVFSEGELVASGELTMVAEDPAGRFAEMRWLDGDQRLEMGELSTSERAALVHATESTGTWSWEAELVTSTDPGRQDDRPQHTVAVVHGNDGAHRFQRVSVNGVVRRVIVDLDGDASRDLELRMDATQRQQLFRYLNTQAPFYTWTPSVFLSEREFSTCEELAG
jgi:hypothetical protein